MDFEIREYIRLIKKISLSEAGKNRIADCLINKAVAKKEFTGKYVATASAVAVLAFSTYLIARGKKQDI